MKETHGNKEAPWPRNLRGHGFFRSLLKDGAIGVYNGSVQSEGICKVCWIRWGTPFIQLFY